MNRSVTAAVAIASLVLTACSSNGAAGDAAAPTPAAITVTETATVTQTETAPAETVTVTQTTTATVTETAAAPVPTGEQTVEGDVVRELTATGEGEEWVSIVTGAEQTEADRIEVRTTVIDPRGADGSEQAQMATDVCEATVDFLEGRGVDEPKVTVFESDGTSFVLYGPSYPGGCTEV